MNKKLKQETSGEWYKDWFDKTYLSLYKNRNMEEARRFLTWMANSLKPGKDIKALDIACGAGRHSFVMATEFGWKVVGVDLSSFLIHQAYENADCGCFQDESISSRSGSERKEAEKSFSRDRKSVNLPFYVRADMRRLPFMDNEFHLVTNLFTSFGYFSENSENLAALKEMARVLTREGTLIFDHINKMYILKNLVAEDRKICNDKVVEMTRNYNESTKRLTKDMRITSEASEARRIRESVRLYDIAEIKDIFASIGLKIDRFFGDYDGAEFNPNESSRMIIFARKGNI